jgi:hypothetical protein
MLILNTYAGIGIITLLVWLIAEMDRDEAIFNRKGSGGNEDKVQTVCITRSNVGKRYQCADVSLAEQ